MSSANFSDLLRAARSYLGFYGELPPENEETLAECMKEAESLARFRYLWKSVTVLPDFLRAEPYASFLAGCSGAVLCVMTLGAETEMRVRRLARTDAARAVALDACASALLEHLSDEYEERFGEERTYRFCFGYGGSPVSDVGRLFRELDPSKIGVSLLPSGLMSPQKSMAGFVGLGKRSVKQCGACILGAHCGFLAEGRTCYGSEKRS